MILFLIEHKMKLSYNEFIAKNMLKQTKNEKIPDLLIRIKNYIENGKYRFSQHAADRRKERFLSLPDILEVLRNGHHEKTKDSWDEKYKEWNYAIRGKTVDQETCRIIVCIDESGLLIITVIRLIRDKL